MTILEQTFDEKQQFNPENPNVYRAKLTKCGAGGVELTVFVPFRMSDELPCDLPVKTRTEEERAELDAKNARRAALRARQSLRFLLRTMRAKYLWTFSWREDMQDLDECQRVYAKFRRELAKTYPETKFVTVPERHHQNRTGWHLHTAVADRLDVHEVRACWWKALGHRVERTFVFQDGKRKLKLVPYIKENGVWREALPSEVMGNVDVVGKPKGYKTVEEWNPERLASYLAKYMDKTFADAEISARRYWPSKDIQRPTVEKFWLMATNLSEALTECYRIVKDLHGMTQTHLSLSSDYTNIWISGNGAEPPF